jgi:hypothetical protein
VKNDAPLVLDPARTTTSPGGDCHVDRLVRISSEERAKLERYEHCITVGRTSTQAHIRCTGDRMTAPASRPAQPDKIFVFERETRLHPVAGILQQPTAPRPRCSECDVHKVPHKGPSGQHLRYTESSSGVVHRFPTKRLLALEIAHACKEDPTCELEYDAFVENSNNPFLRRIMTDPSSIVKNSASNSTVLWEQLLKETPEPISDADLWNVPWYLTPHPLFSDTSLHRC